MEAGNIGGFYFLCACCRVGGASLCGVESVIVLSSWILGYFGMKNLPITIVGPINATRPVMVLVGALVVFGERLNFYQWIGVLMAVFSFLC